MKKLRLVIAVVLIVTGAIGSLYVWKDFKENPETNGEETIPADNIDNLSIDSDFANLTILPAKGSDIQVKWRSKLLQLRQEEPLRYDVEGDTLKIHTARKHKLFRFHIGFGPWSKREVVIYLPERLSELQIDNAVGKTNISSVNMDRLTVKTDVASVKLKNMDTKSAKIETSVGSISLNHVQGNIQATSDVGSISGKMDDIDNDWTLSSNIGEIDLRIVTPDDTSFIANTDVGSVRIFGDSNSYISNSQKSVVEMKTDVGSISVKKGK